jgi:DNA polymerase-3 subunit gamma/tau
MRDGLSLLDQAIAFGGGMLTMSDVKKMLGLVDHEHVTTMIRSLACEDAQSLLAVVEDLVSQSRDLDTVLLNLAEVLHRVTLVQCVPGYSDPERSDWDAISELAELLSAEDAQLFYQIAIKGRDEMGLAPDPRTGLEMALLRMLAFRPDSAQSGGSVSSPLQSSEPEDKKGRPTPRQQPAMARPVTRQPNIEQADIEQPAAELALPAQAPLSSESGDADWVTLQTHLEIGGQVRELARNVQLQNRSEDHWDFIIAPSLRHLGSKACVDRLSQAISEKMGHPVRVRLIDSEGRDMVTAAALDEQKTRQNMSEAEKAINDDPTVKDLKEQLGARIVEDSIQPLQ